MLYEEASPAEGTQRVDTVNVGFFQQFTPEPLGSRIMLLLNNPYPTDVVAETTEITVGEGDDFSISFWHYYWIEADWDGGVVSQYRRRRLARCSGCWRSVCDWLSKHLVGPRSVCAVGPVSLTGRSDPDGFEGAEPLASVPR